MPFSMEGLPQEDVPVALGSRFGEGRSNCWNDVTCRWQTERCCERIIRDDLHKGCVVNVQSLPKTMWFCSCLRMYADVGTCILFQSHCCD